MTSLPVTVTLRADRGPLGGERCTFSAKPYLRAVGASDWPKTKVSTQGLSHYYSVVILQQRSDIPLVSRYTPFLERAEVLFDKFLKDITDPAQLKGS